MIISNGICKTNDNPFKSPSVKNKLIRSGETVTGSEDQEAWRYLQSIFALKERDLTKNQQGKRKRNEEEGRW